MVSVSQILHSLLSHDSNHLRTILVSHLGAPAASPAIAFALGLTISFGVYLVVHASLFRAEGFYLIFTSLFHLLEFVYVSKFHPDTCSLDSFLINHSAAFVMANVLAQLEYVVELMLFGRTYKANWFLIAVGSLLVAIGQVLRTGAMFQAGSHFHHMIQEEQSQKHKLLTTRFYSFSRHPSYVGWFLWAVATQIILANPIMLVLYFVACFTFFKDRIHYEEALLVQQYGSLYEDYAKRVPTRIPGIPGLVLDAHKEK
mmetsp:Transcript_1272/g.4387  ORF Transcript_1272/g.4387 Transcript_1272/m.4387 type:complete len:257 (-) Transcript_1272:68-838(-)